MYSKCIKTINFISNRVYVFYFILIWIFFFIFFICIWYYPSFQLLVLFPFIPSYTSLIITRVEFADCNNTLFIYLFLFIILNQIICFKFKIDYDTSRIGLTMILFPFFFFFFISHFILYFIFALIFFERHQIALVYLMMKINAITSLCTQVNFWMLMYLD
jgi:hypothetical protein